MRVALAVVFANFLLRSPLRTRPDFTPAATSRPVRYGEKGKTGFAFPILRVILSRRKSEQSLSVSSNFYRPTLEYPRSDARSAIGPFFLFSLCLFSFSAQKNLFLRKPCEFSALCHCTWNSPTTHQYPPEERREVKQRRYNYKPSAIFPRALHRSQLARVSSIAVDPPEDRGEFLYVRYMRCLGSPLVPSL